VTSARTRQLYLSQDTSGPEQQIRLSTTTTVLHWPVGLQEDLRAQGVRIGVQDA
jgi:hypothetical protein